MEKEEKKLFDAAMRAREHAYVPESGLKIGAAVLAENGAIYYGCNVENKSYSLTNCAERTAIFSAVASGAVRLFTLLVVADTEEPIMPCGACRQVIAEFGIKKIIAANTKGETKSFTIEELLPYAFVFDGSGA